MERGILVQLHECVLNDRISQLNAYGQQGFVWDCRKVIMKWSEERSHYALENRGKMVCKQCSNWRSSYMPERVEVLDNKQIV